MPFFASIPEMVAASDLVVIGTVTGVTCDERHDADTTLRRSVVTVERTLHGTPRATVVLVHAGDARGGPIIADGVAPPVAGEQAIWFLEQGAEKLTDGRMIVVGPQGHFRIDGDRLHPAVRAPSRPEDVAVVAAEMAALGLDGLEDAVRQASAAVQAGRLSDTWAPTDGCGAVTAVTETRGSGHCEWHRARFVDIALTGTDGSETRTTYVANPAAAGRDPTGWDPDAALPDDAVDTGWRRGSVQLWLDRLDGGQAAFLVDGPTVERLPRDDTGLGCD